MNAVVEISGKQFTVRVGDRLKVASQNQNNAVGNTVTFDRVLFANNGNQDLVGNPTLAGASVEARILEHGRDRKVVIIKKKRRKGYQRKNGHRQGYTLLQIDKIKLFTAKKKPSKKASAKTAKDK